MRPHQRRAAGFVPRLEIAGAPEQQTRTGVPRHQFERDRRARRGIVRKARRLDPRGAVVLDINVQRGRSANGPRRKRDMLERRAGEGYLLEAERRGALVDSFRGRRARSKEKDA